MKQKIDEIWMKRTKSFREFSDRKMTIKNQFISSQIHFKNVNSFVSWSWIHELRWPIGSQYFTTDISEKFICERK